MKIRKLVKNGREQWQVHYISGGEQKRRYFPTEEKATVYAGSIEQEVKRNGDAWLGISQSERLDCMAALEVARAAGIRLIDAARAYTRGRAAAPCLDEAAQQIEVSKRTQGLRERSIASLLHTLDLFLEDRGSMKPDEVTSQEIAAWLNRPDWALATRKSHRTNLQTFFSFCVSHEWVASNPLKKVPVPILDEKEPGILSVDQSRELMNKCAETDPEFLTFFTLCLFCGVRPDEVLSSEPNAVRLSEGRAIITAAAAKGRRYRDVTISKNAAAWIALAPEIVTRPRNWRKRWDNVREAAGLLKDWPHDAMRHTFASHHYALHRNAELTCAELGNSPSVMFTHYRRLVSRAEGKRFFSIQPSI